MKEVAFQIGSITVNWYGILIATGVLAAFGIAFIEAKRRGEATAHVINLALIVIPLGAIGARLYHVIDQWDYYMQNPEMIIGGQGLGIFGAIIGGALGLIIYTRWKKLSTLRWMDIVVPGLILAQAIGRWGNFFNQELYGYPTNLPWGIYIDLSHRLPGYESFSHFHPLFLYESLWNLLGFTVLMVAGRKFSSRLRDGDIFLLYVIHYSIGRFFLEGLKIDVWTLGGIPTARWITGLAVVAAISVLIFRHYKHCKGVNKMKIRRPRGFLLFLAILLMVSLATAAASCMQQTEASTKLGVVVTILPQAEFVENIGGDKVDVTVMVPSGASPHTYEPTPSQMAALSEAQLYAKVGSGVEFELTWLDNLIAQNEDMIIVDCSEGIELQPMTAGDEDEPAGSMDPHIWMSPRNAQIMVQNIADGLIQIDPDNRDYYEQNRDAYLEELAQLDQDIREGLSEVENRVFMVYHPAFGYFASSYDLVMLPIEAEGKEPTPAGLQHLIEQALEQHIKVVFAEPQFNPQSAKVIADAIDGRVVLINPLARDYIENLQILMAELVQAME
jgi:prolipoprotein diacylglyceryl transferase